jgi:phosphoribosylaminoimidazole-succinocarboxamide synthase
VQQQPLSQPLFESRLKKLTKLHQGKVRDLYEIDADHMLIVTTDRLSAFDVIMQEPIPHKGEVLTQISLFWFARTRHIIANHLSDLRIEDIVADPLERRQLAGRAMIVKRLRALPLEAVIRGYLSGSGFKDYLATQSVCGIALPPGLKMADRLPEPIFTPASKAAAGHHDENIDFAAVVALTGKDIALQIREVALRLYDFAARHAHERDIIIADTKFEFGLDADGRLTLIDEALTPDSSRFWPMDSYQPGTSPPSFDKQYVRDYLESLPWDKRPPAPHLPKEVIERTSANYLRAFALLTA